MVFLARMLRLDPGSKELESLIRDLEPAKITGVLKVTFDACSGFIALEEGSVVEGYEIYRDELLVRDRQARNIVERYREEQGKIDIYLVNSHVLQTFLSTLEDDLPRDFKNWFQSLCNSCNNTS
ncbi:MAG: hypothetical protein HXS41_06360 [Theionarchaea archaeon]|nr:hypothetical protein [Theionarchaea archaeon]MBU6999656.1 hypothetical protein [Theionarchaea archaeon]MBU7020662.1 hypothetical protein [Theionarchaea archaeon]MBU7035040.1 hypothetical protein [Theionarchaea archaeon]MBU7039836.1 hypothetical protein [Theionarchaea archaeon]